MSATSSRRWSLVVLGVVLIVGGLVAAGLLWNGASQRTAAAVENFARAPIGCDTTLDFVETGEYLVFVETAGTLDETRGDCDVEGAYETANEDPDVDITLIDPDGGDVDLDRSFGDVEYDASGFRGTARFSIDIEETNDHRLRAQSDTDDVFVVAVGRDPSDGVNALRAGAIAAGVVGLLAGIALILFGARKKSAPTPAGPWTPGVMTAPGPFVPGGPAPQGPPVYGQPSGPPTSGHQPPPPQHPYGQPQHPYGQPQHPYGQPPPPTAGAPGSTWSGQPPAPPVEQPPAPRVEQPYAAQPNIPGEPTFPSAPVDPTVQAPPIDWDTETSAGELHDEESPDRSGRGHPPPEPPQ